MPMVNSEESISTCKGLVIDEKRLPTSLSPIQRMSGGEVDEILVVGQHLDTMF